MPKPLKKNAGTLPTPPKQVQGPAADQPVIDPKTVISEHMRELGTQGGEVSGAERTENLSERQRRNIALKAASARWDKSRPKR